MKPIALLTALFVSTFVLHGPAQASNAEPAKVWLTVEQVAKDVALAEDVYSRVHPGYTRYATTEQMRAAWQTLLQQSEAQGGMTVGDFYLGLSLALTNIRCDHTKAELPVALREARSGKPLYLPFRWELIENRGVIDIAAAGSGLKRGDEILSIDGRPLAFVATEASRYLPVDGFTDWSRRGQISSSADFMGGAVDHFGALLWDPPAEATLEIRSIDGEVRTLSIARIDYDSWVALGRSAGMANNFKDAVRFEPVGKDAAILSIDTFVNYRVPVDPRELYGPIFEELRNEGRDTLILDLRQNGGGLDPVFSGIEPCRIFDDKKQDNYHFGSL